MAATAPERVREVHDLDHAAFLEEVHSFQFWFEAVQGYLTGTAFGHRPETRDEPPAGTDRERLITTL